MKKVGRKLLSELRIDTVGLGEVRISGVRAGDQILVHRSRRGFLPTERYSRLSQWARKIGLGYDLPLVATFEVEAANGRK